MMVTVTSPIVLFCCLHVFFATVSALPIELESANSHPVRLRRSLEFSHPLRRSSTGSLSNFRQPSYPGRPIRLQTRRTLPFQLVPQPPLGYAHSRSFVEERGSRVRPFQAMPSLPAVDDAVIAATTNAKNNYNDADEEGGEGEEVEEVSPADLISMLNSLSSSLDNRHRLRFGFF